MAIIERIPPTISSILSSGTQIEIATGIAIATFYGIDLVDKNILTDVPQYGDVSAVRLDEGGNDETPQDFDLPVKKGFIIEGEGSVSCELLVYNASGGTITKTPTITISIIKDTGSESTLISNTKVLNLLNIADGTSQVQRITVGLTIPRTNFAIGDILRVRIGSSDIGGNEEIFVGTDPKNDTGGDVRLSRAFGHVSAAFADKTLIFLCPFVVDIN